MGEGGEGKGDGGEGDGCEGVARGTAGVAAAWLLCGDLWLLLAQRLLLCLWLSKQCGLGWTRLRAAVVVAVAVHGASASCAQAVQPAAVPVAADYCSACCHQSPAGDPHPHRWVHLRGQAVAWGTEEARLPVAVWPAHVLGRLEGEGVQCGSGGGGVPCPQGAKLVRAAL